MRISAERRMRIILNTLQRNKSNETLARFTCQTVIRTQRSTDGIDSSPGGYVPGRDSKREPKEPVPGENRSR